MEGGVCEFFSQGKGTLQRSRLWFLIDLVSRGAEGGKSVEKLGLNKKKLFSSKLSFGYFQIFIRNIKNTKPEFFQFSASKNWKIWVFYKIDFFLLIEKLFLLKKDSTKIFQPIPVSNAHGKGKEGREWRRSEEYTIFQAPDFEFLW